MRILSNKIVKTIYFALLFYCAIHTDTVFAQGNTCSNPIIVPNLPYVDSNTTCGSADDYGLQCGSDYGGGEEVVYQLTIATPGTVIINANATGGGTNIGWYLKDATDCTNTNNCLVHAESGVTNSASGWYYFSAAGTYYLIIDTRQPLGCTAYDINLSALAEPINSINVCSGGTATLSSQSGGGVSGCVIQWQESIDSGVNWTDIIGANSADYTTNALSQTTYYRAIYTCAGAGCNQAVSNVQIVTVNPLPTIILNSNGPVCAGSDLQLNASGGETYAWSGPNSFTATQSNPTINAVTTAATGNYIVTVTNANGCSSIATIAVLINSSLTVNVSTTSTSCNGGNNGTADATVTGGTAPYTYIWSNNNTTSPISNLVAGTYTVTVTDQNGCTGIGIGTVSEPTLLSASLVISNEIDCFGGADGAATITASGGTTPYTYLWSNGNATNVLNSVLAGTYLATITDGNGCTQTLSATLNEPTEILIISDNITATSCNGISDGAVSISVTGGTPGYTYLWSNGSTTDDISGLSAGNYVVTVTDANGCTSTLDATVTSPSSLAVTSALSQVTCNGGSNGLIDATVTGGTAPYTYIWSDGNTTQDISGLTAGSYVVTITDANGCSITDTYQITEPSAIVVVLDGASGTNCNGTPTGAITISVSGGTTGYTYLWSNGSTTEDISGLSAGNYVVTVTDANGCTSTLGATVTSPSSLAVSATLSQVTCNGGSNGSIDATVTGGTAPYTYIWSNGSTTQDVSGLSAGNYVVTVTDANGCNITDTYQISEPSAIAVVLDGASGTSCNGTPTGAITISVSGGTAGYTYLWSNGSTTDDISGLSAGNYVVTVTDANGCTSTLDATVTSPSSLAVTSALSQVTCNGGSNGSIDATATGGTEPYTYIWSNGNTTEDISGLTAGSYVVTITDANGCSITDTYQITEPNIVDISVDSNTSSSCNGTSDGALAVSIVGGTSPYSYLWSNGNTTEDISGLTAGTYTLTVTDANGCTGTLGATIFTPQAISIEESINQIRCNGEGNGAIGLTIIGGTFPYNYDWSNGAIGSIVGGLPPGTYTVTVTDGNGCTATESYVITQPTALVLTTVSVTNALCDGTPIGAIDITVSGGTPVYTYLWSNGSSNQDLTNVGGGTYNVTVTDANGCTQSASIFIPFGLTIAVTGGIANIGCEAGNIGSIDVTPGGGSTPFSFIWSNGSTTEDLSNIGAGTYSVTITDANGCSATTSTTIQGSSPLSIQPTVTSVNCFGNANGTVDIVTVGGTLPLSYLWSNGSTTQNLSGLSGGNYNLTVTDANGCTATTNTVLVEPALLDPYVANAANITCAGDTNGFIDVEVSGGTNPFTYLWITGATTQDLSELPPGDYKVLVTDANGCTAITGAIIKDVDPLTITIDSLQQVGCTGANDGAIYTTADGGSQGTIYNYLWSTGSTNDDISGLGLGTYTLTVTDGNGCTVTASVNIGNSIPPDIQSVTSSCGAGGSGQITVLAVSNPLGNALLYSINGTTFQSNNLFTNVNSGTYTVTVKDAVSSCTATATVVVTGPATINSVTANCDGGVGTGSIAISATAPAGNTISYSINGADYQNFNVFSSLSNGTYTVYVKNNNNNCITTQTVTVNCLNCSEVATANNNGPVCAGANVGLTANSGGISYAWSGAAGSFTQQNPFIIGITPAQGGVYTVTVTYANGCTATASTTIVLNAAPTITAAVGSCNGTLGVITITAVGSNLQYSLNGFNYQTSNVFPNLQNGTYTVYVRNTATACVVTQSGVIVNCNSCGGTVVASSNSPVCTGSAIVFASTVSGGTPTSYLWNGPAGSSTFPNPTITNATPSKAGVYTVTVTFAGGCTATSSTTVVVRAKPTIQSAIKTCLSDGGKITVTAVSNPLSNGVQYSLGGVNYQSSGVFTGLANGSYTVYVRDIVTGCVSILSTPVVISCATTCTATASNNGPVCPGSSVQLNSTAGGTSYIWSGPSGVSAVQNPVIPNMTPLKAGIYTVTVTYSNGCTATASTNVAIKTAPLAAINTTGPTTFCEGGSVDLIANASGAGPMSYMWSTDDMSSLITAVSGGTYTVTVTNSVGCTATSTINVTVTICCQANAGIVSVDAPPCPDQPLIATGSGYNSTADYAQYYLLANDSNTIIAVSTDGIFATVGLPNGNYSVYGYNVQISPTLGGANPPAVGSLVSSLNAGSCSAVSTTSVELNLNALPVGPVALANVEEGISGVGPFTYNTTTLEIIGGTLPYQFEWETSGYVRYDIETNAAGTGVIVTVYYSDNADFSVTVSDSNGCTDETLQYDNTPGNANEILDIDSYVVTPTADGEANGTIALQVSGGDITCGQYTYEWFGPDGWVSSYATTGGTEYLLEGAVSGWYYVIVTDCNGQMTEGWYWVPEGTRGRTKLDLDALMKAYPNPFDQVTTISFMIGADTDAKVYLYSTDGRIINELFSGRVEKGIVYDVELNAAYLPVGVYFVRLVTGTGTVRIEKLVISR